MFRHILFHFIAGYEFCVIEGGGIKLIIVLCISLAVGFSIMRFVGYAHYIDGFPDMDSFWGLIVYQGNFIFWL